MGTFASEGLGDGLTDAAGRARDEGELGVERSLMGRAAFGLDRRAQANGLAGEESGILQQHPT
jgi:hypothetical protein